MEHENPMTIEKWLSDLSTTQSMYDRYLLSLTGPRYVCAELYDTLMPIFNRLAMLSAHDVNFNELMSELVNFAVEESMADVGLQYYCDYIREYLLESADVTIPGQYARHGYDSKVYIPAVEYLGKAVFDFFKTANLYDQEGCAEYRFSHWLSPTMPVFEKYVPYDADPKQPLGIGLIQRSNHVPRSALEVVVSRPVAAHIRPLYSTVSQWKKPGDVE